MIDMSHANSEKDHRRQINVCEDICGQLSEGEPRIFGVMIESNLIEGNQKVGGAEELTYGQSITDACLGWEDSERCLRRLADASATRAAQGAARSG